MNETFNQLFQQDVPNQLISEINKFGQQDALFQLAAVKSQRAAGLADRLQGRTPRAIYLRVDQHGLDYSHPRIPVHTLPKTWLADLDDAGLAALAAQFDQCVVILNNNDIAKPGSTEKYVRLYNACPSTVFVIWDWDNHHWMRNSTFSAAHSDIYAPAHHENLYLLSRFNWCIAGPVYCATNQWTRCFLSDHIGLIATLDRANTPLGKHIQYPAFDFRNRVVSTLSQHYPSIGFSQPSFHQHTVEDRLREWTSTKSHWISPVLNDVAIRIFDALITGGIPLVPESQRMLPPINQIDRRHILFYTPNDIVSPQHLIDRANALFDEGGLDGVLARHRFALDHHHCNTRIQQLLDHVADKFGVDLH